MKHFTLNYLFKFTTTFPLQRKVKKISTDSIVFFIASAKSIVLVALVWRARRRVTVALSNRDLTFAHVFVRLDQ